MRSRLVLVCLLLLGVIAPLDVSADKDKKHHGGTMEEFFDLDEMFGYHISDNKESTSIGNDNVDIKLTEPVTTTSVPPSTSTTKATTTKTTRTNNVYTDTDDEDVDVISGAGSGSGMEDNENQETNNETILTFLDSEGVQINSGEGKDSETEDFLLTGTTLSSEGSTFTSTKPTSAAPTTSDIVLDHPDNEEGAADGDIIDWVLPEEGGKDDDDDDDDDDDESDESNKLGEGELVTTTLTPSQKQEISEIFVPPYIPVQDPCEKLECYHSAVCVSNNGESNCVCQFNCSDSDSVDVCGADGVLYPNDCARRLASCEQQRLIDIVNLKSCPGKLKTFNPFFANEYRLKHPDLPTCKIVDAPRWSRWSPWIRHGDVDIRVRSCTVEGYVTRENSACDGPRVEAKACTLRQIGKCVDINGNETRQMKFSCDGIDIKDTENADLTFGGMAETDECLYSLFDLTRKKAVFNSWNITRILTEGSLRRWCHRPELYVMSHTSVHSCKKNLVNICKQSRKCKHNKDTKQRNLGDYGHNCWKNFLFGNRIPDGLSDTESRYSFICQRFAPDSSLGKVFGHKEAYYGTIYDTKSRLPVVSLATIKSLGDEMWPDTPYMVEHGLFEEDSSFFWLFKNRRRGMETMADIKRCELDWECEMGKKQALPIDFQNSGYRMAPLIWPELIGLNIDAKISTFTLTNMAAMHPSLYPSWRNAVREIRRYAEIHCKIPVSDKPNRPYVMLQRSTLHLASGAVASHNPTELIGNDVNVPFMFWMAGCCVRDQEVKSFAIYARNIPDSRVISSSVLQLETLLQDIYRVKPRHVGPTIFPGNDGMCGNTMNDDSQNLIL